MTHRAYCQRCGAEMQGGEAEDFREEYHHISLWQAFICWLKYPVV